MTYPKAIDGKTGEEKIMAHLKIIGTGPLAKNVNIIYVDGNGTETNISDVVSFFEITGTAQDIIRCELGVIKVIPEFEKVALQEIFVSEHDDSISK